MSNQIIFNRNLQQARVQNTKWVAMIKILTLNLPTKDYEFEPTLLHTNFGKWFYKEATLLSATNCAGLIEDIELTLLSMYQNFIPIYEITIIDRKTNFLGKNKLLTTLEKETINKFYLKIVAISSKFHKQLKKLEKVLNAKSEQEFAIFSSIYQEEPKNSLSSNNKDTLAISG